MTNDYDAQIKNKIKNKKRENDKKRIVIFYLLEITRAAAK
jgi:hypothetical protein